MEPDVVERSSVSPLRRALARAIAGGVLVASGLAGRPGTRARNKRRDRCPRGTVIVGSGTPKRAVAVFQSDAGLTALFIAASDNADTSIPSFGTSERNPVVVSSEKIDPSQPARVAIKSLIGTSEKTCTFSF
jgi:hypothetical protein